MAILLNNVTRCVNLLRDGTTRTLARLNLVYGIDTIKPTLLNTNNQSIIFRSSVSTLTTRKSKLVHLWQKDIASCRFLGACHPNKLTTDNCINLTSAAIFHTSHTNFIMEDRQTKALTVWNNIRELRSSPMPALSLGLSGLLPFVGVPTYMLLSSCYVPQLAFAQVVYGATILSFLGGVRWGFTIPEENPIPPDWKNLGYSVMPSLVAWVGLMLPHPVSLFTMMGGLSAAAYFDMAMYGYPPWFKGLRFLLSFIAVLSLWTTFVCSLLLDTKTDLSLHKQDTKTTETNMSKQESLSPSK